MDSMFRELLVWLLVVTVGSEGPIRGKTTCESGGLGEQARVVCRFSQDVKETHGVRVVLLTMVSLHDASRNTEMVVRCYLFPGNGFDCLKGDGYTTYGTIRDQMIVDIPTAKPEHQGSYACQIVMANTTIQMESCNLIFTEAMNGKTACESGGLGDQARVACRFSQDVKETNGVRVVLLTRVSLHGANINPEMVVRCYLFPGNGFDCLNGDGYTTNGTIRDQMIVDIPTAKPEHQGSYACQIVMANTTIQTESCNLTFTEAKNSAKSKPPSVQENDDLRKIDAGTSDNSDAKVWVYTTAVVSVVAVVIAILSAVLVIVCWRRRFGRKQPQRNTDVRHPEYPDTGDGDGPRNDGNQPSDEPMFTSCRQYASSTPYRPPVECTDLEIIAPQYWNSESHLAVHGHLYHLKDNLMYDGYRQCQVTHPSSRTSSVVQNAGLPSLSLTQGRLITGDTQGNGDSENLNENGLSEDAAQNAQRDGKITRPTHRYDREHSNSDLDSLTSLLAADTEFSQTQENSRQVTHMETIV